jgi:serine/threonine-protein kinase
MTAQRQTLGRYEIRGILGGGGFATVYRVWDPMLNREVALKAVHGDRADPEDVRARFLAEARALASLRHPNIITVHDIGEAGGRPFFTMECIDGKTLAEMMEPDTGMTLAQAVEILCNVSAAVDYLHGKGLVHR